MGGPTWQRPEQRNEGCGESHALPLPPPLCVQRVSSACAQHTAGGERTKAPLLAPAGAGCRGSSGAGGWGAWPLSRCPDQTAAVRDGAAARAQAGCLVPGGAGGSSCGSRRGAARAPPGRPLASNLSPSSAAGRPRGVPDAAERLVPVPLGVPARQPAPFLPGLLAECECLSASSRCPVWLGALVPVPAEGRGGSGRLATCLGRGQSVAEPLGDPFASRSGEDSGWRHSRPHPSAVFPDPPGKGPGLPDWPSEARKGPAWQLEVEANSG